MFRFGFVVLMALLLAFLVSLFPFVIFSPIGEPSTLTLGRILPQDSATGGTRQTSNPDPKPIARKGR